MVTFTGAPEIQGRFFYDERVTGLNFTRRREPQITLLHALLSLRDRPASEKAAWRAVFDYYVFGDAVRPAVHLPEAAHGPLAPIDAMQTRRLRAQLLHRLNR
ncbi:hypothetical protein [Sphingomonas elodea]|uniref:hypothetical protein n=1 Tax=Sphingomonas elodea TaxID=179878 RepID=UPI0002630919